MSTKAVIVSLFLAIVLGIATFILLKYPGGGGGTSVPATQVPVGARIVEFSPGDVRQIVVETPSDGTRQIIERAPGGKGILGADADWQLRIEPIKATDTDASLAAVAPWPLESSRIQTLLRVLAETRAVAPAPDDAALGERPTKVQLQFPDHVSTWLLAERTLAGTGLVQIDAPKSPTRRAVVRDDLHRVFIDPGPRGWRERYPLGGIAPDASRIRLESATQKLLIARTDGKWFLREPAAAPADPVAIQRLTTELARVQIADFLDTGSAGASTGMEHPAATIRIEADRRTVEAGSAEPKVSTDSVQLEIGGAAGSSSGKVYASVNENRMVLLDGRSVGIASDPAAYVWPHPMREVSSNIGGFSVALTGAAQAATGGHLYKRAGARWSHTLPGGSEVPLSDAELRGVDEVLAFLTGERASATGGAGTSGASASAKATIAFAAPTGAKPIGTLRVDGLTGSPLDTLELLLVDADKVSVRTGTVWRTYAIGTLPALLQNAASAAAQSSSPSPASSPPTP